MCWSYSISRWKPCQFNLISDLIWSIYWSISGNEFSLRMRRQRRPEIQNIKHHVYISFYRTQVNLGSDLWVRMSVRHWVSPTPCWNLTELTLADEDTKSILTDNANRAIQGNVTMQVMQPGGQVWKQCKWRHLMTKFWTNPSCAVWWPNMQLIQVVPSGGQICN